MLKVIRSLFTLALLLAAGVALAAAEVKPYARDDLASDVVRLTDTLRKETAQIGAKLKGKSAEQLRKDAASAVAAGNYKDAGAWLGAVVAADPKDSASWLALAKLGAQADDAQADGRYDLVDARPDRRLRRLSARDAARRSRPRRSPLLGDLFARHEMWRPALDAYRASLDRHDDEDARKTYEDMREKHGFRIVDYKVDNESSAPRDLLQLLRAAGAQDGFRALCRGRRRRRTRRSRPRTSRSASRASSTASATRSFCARVCPRRSASRCSRTRTTRSTCATARRRRISPAAPMCCRARASSARR